MHYLHLYSFYFSSPLNEPNFKYSFTNSRGNPQNKKEILMFMQTSALEETIMTIKSFCTLSLVDRD